MCLELCFPFPPGTSQDSQGEGVAPVWGGEGTGPGMGSATSGRCDSMGFSLAAAPGKGGIWIRRFLGPSSFSILQAQFLVGSVPQDRLFKLSGTVWASSHHGTMELAPKQDPESGLAGIFQAPAALGPAAGGP